ncbi:hypothetical protein psyc5s11_28640 [Clostridium gelidum]|uniref:Uncharacterized protein n=1 Tax=Clostridium gelidum TaxID=704125 RepID=A0ABM7T742_9CLOT|nr:hypothetical protein psyc5s11_28640 [Clostridium gelidum]
MRIYRLVLESWIIGQSKIHIGGIFRVQVTVIVVTVTIVNGVNFILIKKEVIVVKVNENF